MKNIKTFSEYENSSVSEGKLSFTSEKEGTEIVNPFYDTTGRSQVNPQTAYGDDYTNSELHDVVDSFVSLNGQSKNLLDIFLKWKESAPDEKTLDDFMKGEKRHMKPAIVEIRKCLDKIEKYV